MKYEEILEGLGRDMLNERVHAKVCSGLPEDAAKKIDDLRYYVVTSKEFLDKDENETELKALEKGMIEFNREHRDVVSLVWLPGYLGWFYILPEDEKRRWWKHFIEDQRECLSEYLKLCLDEDGYEGGLRDFRDMDAEVRWWAVRNGMPVFGVSAEYKNHTLLVHYTTGLEVPEPASGLVAGETEGNQ